MSEVTHVLDLLPAYALGSLEEPEARRVVEHLAICAACRMELAEFEGLTTSGGGS
jgi:anti-sigma factor RsiW